MKLTNYSFRDLFTQETALTFLVGAGSSVDAPSCLPAGRTMMDAIIRHICSKSEIEKIISIQELRFEALIEVCRDQFDKELKIIDYYGYCDQPNLQHFFFAEMITKGHFVLTTNFDCLIEHALLQSEIPKDEIIPVITKADFEKYDNPHDVFIQGKKTVYKIHGSTKNVIIQESTKDSLVATIQAFGSNKEGLNIFQVQPFQRNLFNNISKGRSLVIMGYSGSDDFDVVPTLKVLSDIKNLIWINYVPNDGGKEKIYEITPDMNDIPDKVNQIIVDIVRAKNAEHVYRVDVNTTRLIKQLLITHPDVSTASHTINPHEWLTNNIKSPSEIMKIAISNKIYFDFDMYEDSMRCLKLMLQMAETNENEKWKSTALGYIGLIYHRQGNSPEANKRYEQALKIDEQLGNLSGKATRLNNIGLIYDRQGNYPEALTRLGQTLKIEEQLGDLSGKASSLSNIGLIYKDQGNYPEALKRFEQGLKIDEQLGDLSGRAIKLGNIGLIYKYQGNYPEALKCYEQGFKIAENLGDIYRKATFLNNIATIHFSQGNYQEALRRYEKALKIDEQLGDLSGKAIRLNNIGLIYKAKENYPEALKRYEKALKIDEQLGDLSGKAIRLNNIGQIYQAKKNYPEALKRYEKALKIDEQLGNLSEKAIRLNNIGWIYKAQENYPEALKKYEQALKIDIQLGNLSGKATFLNNIASIHNTQKNYHMALELFNQSLEILNQLGEKPKQAAIYNSIGTIYDKMNKKDDALKSFELAWTLYHEIGLNNKAKKIQSVIKKLKKKKKR